MLTVYRLQLSYKETSPQILTKNLWWTSVLLKLSQQSRQLYQKTELILEPSVEALQILMYLQENLLGGCNFSVGLDELQV